jgi:hypothetical protein
LTICTTGISPMTLTTMHPILKKKTILFPLFKPLVRYSSSLTKKLADFRIAIKVS